MMVHQLQRLVPVQPLATRIFRIGFKSADRIGVQLGISPSSPERAEAGILHVLGELSNEGHVFYPRRKLIEAAAAFPGD